MRLRDSYLEWFRQMWPTAARRHAAMAGYRALGQQHEETLADIALRNHVFSECPDQVAEGRRRAALEIFKLAKIDLDRIWDAIERKPTENRT